MTVTEALGGVQGMVRTPNVDFSSSYDRMSGRNVRIGDQLEEEELRE